MNLDASPLEQARTNGEVENFADRDCGEVGAT